MGNKISTIEETTVIVTTDKIYDRTILGIDESLFNSEDYAKYNLSPGCYRLIKGKNKGILLDSKILEKTNIGIRDNRTISIISFDKIYIVDGMTICETSKGYYLSFSKNLKVNQKYFIECYNLGWCRYFDFIEEL